MKAVREGNYGYARNALNLSNLSNNFNSSCKLFRTTQHIYSICNRLAFVIMHMISLHSITVG